MKDLNVLLQQARTLNDNNYRSMIISSEIATKYSKELIERGFSVKLKSEPFKTDPTDEKSNPEHYNSGCPENMWYFQLEWTDDVFKTRRIKSKYDSELKDFKDDLDFNLEQAILEEEKVLIMPSPKYIRTYEIIRNELALKGYLVEVLDNNDLLIHL